MESRKYLEFDLMLERTDTGYRARVLAAPAGTAVGEFGFPFSELELENFVLRMGQKRQTTRRTDSSELAAAREFGSRLYDTVFLGSVRSALDGSLMEAAEQKAGLRIRLRFAGSAPELIDLPWEYLYNPDKKRFLSLSIDSPLVRDLDLTGRIEPLRIEPPLRVLVMISSPSDYDLLDVEKEWGRLKEAVADLEAAGRIVLDRTEAASLSALQRQLRREEYHIFHFIGHGGFDAQASDGVLVFVDENGRGRKIGGQQLATLLHDEKTLRLAILNACEGGRTSYTDPFAGVAQSLLQQDIPAVIAMQFEVSDRAAITLAHEFYAAIADGYPVDAALSEARKSIYADVSDVEWGTPVLYMRVADGRVFDVQGVAQPAVPPPASIPAALPATPVPAPAPGPAPAASAPSTAPSALPPPTPTAGGGAMAQDVRRLLPLAGIGVAAIVLVLAAFFLLRSFFDKPVQPPLTTIVTPPVVDNPTPSGNDNPTPSGNDNPTPSGNDNPTPSGGNTPVPVMGDSPTATPTPQSPTFTPTSAALSAFSRELQRASASYPSFAVDGCDLPSRLWVGALAFVYDSKENPLREEPQVSARKLASLARGTGMRVIDGPVCADNEIVYWHVSTQEKRADDGQPLTGWMAESDSASRAYLLAPLVHPLAYYPGSEEVCPGLYPSRLKVGDTAVVTFEPPMSNLVRRSASRNAGDVFNIEPGASVTIIGGPACADGWVWWQVENSAGQSGWTSEGDVDIYWLLPVDAFTSTTLRPGKQGTFVALPESEVTLDGKFDDWTGPWQPLTVWSYPAPARFGNGLNLSAVAQVGWQTDGLLVAVQVVDDRYSYASNTSLSEIWRQDGVELLFDRALTVDQSMTSWNNDDYQVVVAFGPDGDTPVAYQFNERAAPAGRVQVLGASTRTEVGYAAEFFLPWSAFGLEGLAEALAAQPFGFTLSVNDRDSSSSQERILSSSPARQVQNNPTQWGTLLLAGASQPRASNFAHRGGSCQSATTLPLSGGMERVCITFDYAAIPQGALVVREWNFLGTDRSQRLLWARYECLWDQPESGQLQVDLRDPDVGLRSGIWEMSLSVEGKTILRGEVEIPGNAGGWAPVTSTIRRCK